jgi:hypothetical protein
LGGAGPGRVAINMDNVRINFANEIRNLEEDDRDDVASYY